MIRGLARISWLAGRMRLASGPMPIAPVQRLRLSVGNNKQEHHRMRTILLLITVPVLMGVTAGSLTRDDRLALRTAQVSYLQSRLNLMQAQQEAIKAETDLS